MKIMFHSRTGNVRRFVNKLGLPSEKIIEGCKTNEPFVLVTYTDKIGGVPEKVEDFLGNNHLYMIGVAASGNKNFGDAFAKSANIISDKYDVPIIRKFELSGSDIDVKTMRGWVMDHEHSFSRN